MGEREFAQVLRLMEVFAIEDVAAGDHDAIDRGVIGFDSSWTVRCGAATWDMSHFSILPGPGAEFSLICGVTSGAIPIDETCSACRIDLIARCHM